MECSTVIQTADQVVFPADVIIKRSIAQPDQQEFRLCLKVKKSGLETFLIPIVGLIGGGNLSPRACAWLCWSVANPEEDPT